MPHTETIHFQCRHIFTDGHRCQSPTLRGPGGQNKSGGPETPQAHENFCYYHHTTRRPVENPKSRKSRQSTFTLPQLEDRSAIQLAIGQVLQKIAANDIDPRRAGLLLYGLQIASLNLKQDRRSGSGSARRREEPDQEETVSEITHDPLLGPLAPPAELHSEEPKGTAQRLLEEFDRRDAELGWDDNEKEEQPEQESKEATLPSLNAAQHRKRPLERSRPHKPLTDGPSHSRCSRRSRLPRPSPSRSATPDLKN